MTDWGIFEVSLPNGTSFTLAVKNNTIRIRGNGWVSQDVEALPNQELTKVRIEKDKHSIFDKPIDDRRVSSREAFERLVGIFCKVK